MISLLRKSSQTWKRFWADASGAVLFYITATLPALVGFSLLAIDASRVMTLHTSLQKGVDAIAIAAAGELDRAPDAMSDAQKAADNLVKNWQLFGEGNRAIETQVTLRFFSELPATDDLPMPTTFANGLLDAANPDHDFLARFVEATVAPYTSNAIFPASFLGGENSALVNATAVAGNDSVVCDLMPLFICNPFEVAGDGKADGSRIILAAQDPAVRRRMIRMKAGPGTSGPNTAFFPGDFGFLDMGNGAPALADAIARDGSLACFVATGVDTETGHKEGPVEAAMNVRFGLYKNPGFGGESGNILFRPARNVRMGQEQKASDFPGGKGRCTDHVLDNNPANGLPLPRDPCFATENCPYLGGKMGEGPVTADLSAYWLANYGETLPDAINPALPAAANTSRYEIYLYELANNKTGTLTKYADYQKEPLEPTEIGNPSMSPGGAEPSCYTGDAADLTDDPDRRIINAAIINCLANAPLQGHEVNVPVAAFAEFFITEPMSDDGERSIWAELVRVIQPGNGGIVKALDQVQLYR